MKVSNKLRRWELDVFAAALVSLALMAGAAFAQAPAKKRRAALVTLAGAARWFWKSSEEARR